MSAGTWREPTSRWPELNYHLTNTCQIEPNAKRVGHESFMAPFDLQVQKNQNASAAFVAPPSLCACVTVATERATIIYSLSYSEPLAKVPGDQLALETHWCCCGDNLLQTAKEVL